jgi:hypothetical protein
MQIRLLARFVSGVTLVLSGYVLGAHLAGLHPGNPGWAPIIGPARRILIRHSDWGASIDFRLLEGRWAWESTAVLGSVWDSQAIYNIELPEHSHLSELRWVSSDMAMGYGNWWEGNLASSRFYFLFLKQNGRWTIYRSYRLSIS